MRFIGLALLLVIPGMLRNVVSVTVSWSTVMLFGKVPRTREPYIFLMSIGATCWIVAAVTGTRFAGVRVSVTVPLDVAAERRGVLLICSATPDFFTERDRTFVETVARWVGLVGYHAAHVSSVVAQAAEEATCLATERAIEVLTRRQREVARLIGAGLTNEQIAQQLMITPGTTANHVEGILRRLGVTSRL